MIDSKPRTRGQRGLHARGILADGVTASFVRKYNHRVTLRFRVAMLMRERRRPRPSLDELRLELAETEQSLEIAGEIGI